MLGLYLKFVICVKILANVRTQNPHPFPKKSDFLLGKNLNSPWL